MNEMRRKWREKEEKIKLFRESSINRKDRRSKEIR